MARYMMILYTVYLWGWYFGSTSIDDMTWDEMPGNMQLHAVAIVAIIAPDWHLDNNWTTRCCNMLLYNFWIFLAISGTSNMCQVKIPFRTDSKKVWECESKLTPCSVTGSFEHHYCLWTRPSFSCCRTGSQGEFCCVKMDRSTGNSMYSALFHTFPPCSSWMS